MINYSILFIILFVTSLNAYSSSGRMLLYNDNDHFLGRYQKKDTTFDVMIPDRSESIILSRDSFSYTKRRGLILNKTVGTWTVINDTLVLNSFNKEFVIDVVKKSKKNKRTFYFNITDRDNYLIGYKISFVGSGDTLIFENKTSITKIKRKKLNKYNFFFITMYNTGIKYPDVKLNKHNNLYIIHVYGEILFDNEKWPIKNGQILPRDISGNYNDYMLIKDKNYKP